MTRFAPGMRPDNSDADNFAARGLSMMAITLGVIGGFIMILGLTSSPTTSNGIQTDHNYTEVVAGVSLVGAALSIWVLLLMFWAWRYERRQHPTPGFQVDQPAPVSRTDQSARATSVAISPAPSDTVLLAASKVFALGLSIGQIGDSRIVTIARGGNRYLLFDDLAVIMSTSVAAITKANDQNNLAGESFACAIETGSDVLSELGMYLPTGSLPGLLKRIPAARGRELLDFAKN